MKKVFAILLALSLVLMMGTTAFAAGTGAITITNAAKEADYSIYQMLNFTASNSTASKGIYTIVAGWEDFFENNAIAKTVFDVVTNSGQTTVVLKKDVTAVDQALAKEAIKYAETKGIAAIETKEANGTTVEFTNLPLGYYAIDTSLGTLCALTNANSTFTTTEKNEKPDINKKVKEDNTGAWGAVNDDDIGKTINYQSEITIGVGGTQYVMHDTMTAGLTFNNDVKVTLNDVEIDEADYTVNDNPGDGHTFDIIFDDNYIAGLAKGAKLVVTYSATLNTNAVIAGEGNKNTVYLSYGESDDLKTNEHTTTTYTWQMDVFKFTKEGDTDIGLANAKFQLLLGATPLKFTKVDGTETPTYRYDANGTEDTITTDTTGKFIILGLDADNYDLKETEAPVGYNKLAGPVAVKIKSTANPEATALTYQINDEAPATIKVENKTGGLFPETGGIGTTLFYVVGAILMISAAVVLISKKRMNGYV